LAITRQLTRYVLLGEDDEGDDEEDVGEDYEEDEDGDGSVSDLSDHEVYRDLSHSYGKH